MKIDGSCHCGAITYEAEADPAKASICHCTDCQTLSGTPFRTIVSVDEKDFRLLSGAPKTYVKTAESGNRRAQTFCENCGTPIYATSVGEGPKTLGLRVGAIRQREAFVPQIQRWCRSSQPWLDTLQAVPRQDK